MKEQGFLTLVHAGLVEILDKDKGFWFIGGCWLLDQYPHLLIQFIIQHSKRRHLRLVIRDDLILDEPTTGKVVEVIARVHGLVHVPNQRRRCGEKMTR